MLHHAGPVLLHLHVAPRRLGVLARLGAAFPQGCLACAAGSDLRVSRGWRAEGSNGAIGGLRRGRSVRRRRNMREGAVTVSIVGFRRSSLAGADLGPMDMSEGRGGDKGAERERGDKRLHLASPKW